MQNIARVLPKLTGPDYTELKLLNGTDGNPWFVDTGGSYWRAFNYIQGSSTFHHSSDKAIARESGRIIGHFHKLVSYIPLKDIHTTLPDFHNLNTRMKQLEASLTTARPERLADSLKWRELAGKLSRFCEAIPFDKLPLRLCHNDTKLSNILFDSTSKKALCLIDLDTLMPGYLLYDFGDAGRCLVLGPETTHVNQNEASFDLNLFEAFYKGFIQSGLELNAAERKSLPWGLVLMPLLHGVRALTDYLQNDLYYKTSFPGENLRRAARLLQHSEASRKRLPQLRAICEK
jgi:Ser/Thr protein kinase RdoA (MazF antagonist)